MSDDFALRNKSKKKEKKWFVGIANIPLILLWIKVKLNDKKTVDSCEN